MSAPKAPPQAAPPQAPATAAALPTLADGGILSAADCEAVFGEILDGRVDDARLGALLMGLRVRGETPEEIIGAARAIRRRMLPARAPAGAVDNCGTGGDGKESWNISTAASFAAAACGAPVAKHGSRAASGRSGASDVLTALGARVDCPVPALEDSLARLGYAFLMAPRHHAAMRHVAPARASLRIRTPFNLLGPLCNPAGVGRQLLGCFSAGWLEPLAQALGRLGGERAWVVHGAGGFDELTPCGDNRVVALEPDGSTRAFVLAPEAAGLARSDAADLRGGGAAENAEAIRAVFSGARGRLAAFADAVAFNAGACLVVAGVEDDLRRAVERAAEATASGPAAALLEAYAAHTRAAAEAAEANPDEATP